jgi:transposase
METITLNKEQQRRAGVLARLSSGGLAKDDAGGLLGVTRRQVNRLLKDYERDGLASVVHGNTGRLPTNKIRPEIAEMIVSLVGEDGKYQGFNTCHLHDLLAEYEEIPIGRSTLYRMLREKGVIKPERRKRQVRRTRRTPYPREGMLLQIDGSSHDWLSGRGPKITLIGAIDDATGKIISAVFRPSEDQQGYLMLMRSIAVEHGLPESYYHDKHTILRSPKEATIEDELAGKEPMSQLQRVMSELGIASIPAHSPQAKGRIERLWKTLQDRLTREMTLSGVSSIDEANAFLPRFIERFNERFGREPEDAESAWVEIGADTDLDYYFAICESRVVRQDHTIAWYGKAYQILPDEGCMVTAGKRVEVRVTPEGHTNIYSGKHRLAWREVQVVRSVPKQPTAPSKQPKPADPRAAARRRGWLYQPNAA